MSAPARSIRSLVAEVGNGTPVDRSETMHERLAATTAEARCLTSLLGSLALLALLLAAVGTCATANDAVTRRLREMGIRRALGAPGPAVLSLFLRNAALTAAIGIAAGTGLGLVLTRYLRSYIFGIGAQDPVAFLTSAGVLGGAALLASLIPAVRAARVDPDRVLRDEI